MNTKQTLRELEIMGTAQNRKIYRRHYATGKLFGVSYANLGKLKKKIGIDHALARGLWESGVHDARVLATMVGDPAALSIQEANTWVKDLDNDILASALAGLVGGSPHARGRAKLWTRSKNESVSSTGWTILVHLTRPSAGREETLQESELASYLELIEAGIDSAPNQTRYSMNNALISIGCLGGVLQRKAVAAAKRIGKVEVDHGETSCKTPDAVSYIAKTVAHRKQMATRRAKKKVARKARV